MLLQHGNLLMFMHSQKLFSFFNQLLKIKKNKLLFKMLCLHYWFTRFTKVNTEYVRAKPLFLNCKINATSYSNNKLYIHII